MAKRNKNKSKQRKKRYLRRRISKSVKAAPVAKPVPSIPKPIPSTQLLLSTYKTVNRDYQAVLDRLFNRKILVVDRYLNENATIIHFCRDCMNRFYSRPAFLTSGIQPHVCFSPKSHPNSSGYGIPKLKKVKGTTWEEFQQMVWEDLTFREIAKKMGVDPKIIKDYFVRERLI